MSFDDVPPAFEELVGPHIANLIRVNTTDARIVLAHIVGQLQANYTSKNLAADDYIIFTAMNATVYLIDTLFVNLVRYHDENDIPEQETLKGMAVYLTALSNATASAAEARESVINFTEGNDG